MRIYLDLPDDPLHDVGPYPLMVHDAIGYLVVLVKNTVDGKKMLYSVGRASVDHSDDAMMKALEDGAKKMVEIFDKEKA